MSTDTETPLVQNHVDEKSKCNHSETINYKHLFIRTVVLVGCIILFNYLQGVTLTQMQQISTQHMLTVIDTYEHQLSDYKSRIFTFQTINHKKICMLGFTGEHCDKVCKPHHSIPQHSYIKYSNANTCGEITCNFGYDLALNLDLESFVCVPRMDYLHNMTRIYMDHILTNITQF